jgi:hypothetical protein
LFNAADVEGLACGGFVQADLKQAYTATNVGLRLGCVKGQSFVHMQVKQISLDFLGTFFIKEKGTKHIYNTNHPGLAENIQ